MYRRNGDLNNNLSHSIHRTYGPQPPQLTFENSSADEDQSFRDDHYLNLLYKPYDSSNPGICHRINNWSNMDHFNATRSTMNFNINENDKAWRSSLINYRIMDAQLARIQQDCEFIENSLARVGVVARNDKRLDVTNNSSLDLNLVGSPLTTTVSHSSAPAGPNLTLNTPPTTTLPADMRLQFHHSSILNNIPSIYQLPPIAEQVEESTAELNSPVATERQSFEQELRRQMESNSAFVSKSNTQPYRCPVCWNCVRQRKPTSTICGHVFCSSCIKTALRSTCKCPVCQRLMTVHQIFRIYI